MSANPFLLIFSDLDGTLLDHNNYRWEEAQPALDLCKRLNIPVVLVSSKTRAEIDLLRRKLSISAPFISENGGGIFFPSEVFNDPSMESLFVTGTEMPLEQTNKDLWKWPLGLPYEHLVKGLREIRDELKWNIKGFSDMSIEEISSLTGLDRQTSRLAAMREYDEPFIILEKQLPDTSALFNAAAKKGFVVTVGRRFYHLQGKNDKGQSMEKVISWYKQFHDNIVSLALGDSQNDFPMLKRADYPILVRSKSDFQTPNLKIPRLRVTNEIGPKGWNSAVLEILNTNNLAL
jgi:mannosyl-3-phosphoglycerate phosphatase